MKSFSHSSNPGLLPARSFICKSKMGNGVTQWSPLFLVDIATLRRVFLRMGKRFIFHLTGRLSAILQKRILIYGKSNACLLENMMSLKTSERPLILTKTNFIRVYQKMETYILPLKPPMEKGARISSFAG